MSDNLNDNEMTDNLTIRTRSSSQKNILIEEVKYYSPEVDFEGTVHW